jgi:hypothetical protein
MESKVMLCTSALMEFFFSKWLTYGPEDRRIEFSYYSAIISLKLMSLAPGIEILVALSTKSRRSKPPRSHKFSEIILDVS